MKTTHDAGSRAAVAPAVVSPTPVDGPVVAVLAATAPRRLLERLPAAEEDPAAEVCPGLLMELRMGTTPGAPCHWRRHRRSRTASGSSQRQATLTTSRGTRGLRRRKPAAPT